MVSLVSTETTPKTEKKKKILQVEAGMEKLSHHLKSPDLYQAKLSMQRQGANELARLPCF